MLFHSLATDHKMVLSYADLSVWCYACDSYVHNQVSMPIDIIFIISLVLIHTSESRKSANGYVYGPFLSVFSDASFFFLCDVQRLMLFE